MKYRLHIKSKPFDFFIYFYLLLVDGDSLNEVQNGIPELVVTAKSRTESLEEEHHQSTMKKTPVNAAVQIKLEKKTSANALSVQTLEARKCGELKLIFMIDSLI